ncbi:MAG: hypothetical protein E7241_06670 [Lachnospiraceae bacterium]|nr:hypothetical protein [Lachnospiraceae bacterium]
MRLFKLVAMYINLFFSINKNMFYERYRFIAIRKKNKMRMYVGWFVFKNYVLVLAGVHIVNLLLKNSWVSATILVMMMVSVLFKVDAQDWKAYERIDYKIAIPDEGERSIIVLLGNIIYHVFLENNAILYIILICRLLDLGFLEFACIFSCYLIIYALISLIYFILKNSTIVIKKVYSVISYVFSFLSTLVIIYCVLKIVIEAIKVLATNGKMENVLVVLIDQDMKGIVSIIEGKVEIVLLILAIIVIGILMTYYYTLKRLKELSYEGWDDDKYRVESFFVIALFERIVQVVLKDEKKKEVVKKEFALFADIYRYKFKDYGFVILFDRSVAVLLSIIFLLEQYSIDGKQCVLLCLFPLFLMLDINSAVSVKLIVNMSFVSDYRMILVANSNGMNIEELVRSKLMFFYIIKSISLVGYLVIANTILITSSCPWYIVLFSNLLCAIVVYFLPRSFIVNNIIYTRLDYDDYGKYLEESKILERGVGEFIAIKVLYKLMSIVTIITPVTLLAAPIVGLYINPDVYAVIVAGLFSVAVVLVHTIMSKTERNIIHYIERGDYSVDFAKIFK